MIAEFLQAIHESIPNKAEKNEFRFPNRNDQLSLNEWIGKAK